MAIKDEHVKHCENRYGFGFREVHEWMDGPAIVSPHGKFRHDPDRTPEKAREIFGDKVPGGKEKFIENAVLDHIERDNRQVTLPRWVIKSPRAEKPCQELNYCPYGFLVEYFPTSEEAKEKRFVCGAFGHVCPVFCVKENETEEDE